jgi:hypothetical protein
MSSIVVACVIAGFKSRNGEQPVMHFEEAGIE